MRRRREGAERTSFGKWIRATTNSLALVLPKEKAIELFLTKEQQARIDAIKLDTGIMKFYGISSPDFIISVPDSPYIEFQRVRVGGYSYTTIGQVSWSVFSEHFKEELDLEGREAREAIKQSAEKVDEVLRRLEDIKPLAHIYWTWPLIARECFLGIPKPIRMRQGAQRVIYLHDGSLLSDKKEELTQELHKLMMVYSATKKGE